MGELDQGEYLTLNLIFQAILRDFQIIASLQVEPERGGGAKSARQAQRSIGCDTAPALNNRINAVWGNAQGTRQGILADAQRLEELFQQNPRRDGWEEFRGSFCTSSGSQRFQPRKRLRLAIQSTSDSGH